jgi:hypothetical protein
MRTSKPRPFRLNTNDSVNTILVDDPLSLNGPTTIPSLIPIPITSPLKVFARHSQVFLYHFRQQVEPSLIEPFWCHRNDTGRSGTGHEIATGYIFVFRCHILLLWPA